MIDLHETIMCMKCRAKKTTLWVHIYAKSTHSLLGALFKTLRLTHMRGTSHSHNVELQAPRSALPSRPPMTLITSNYIARCHGSHSYKVWSMREIPSTRPSALQKPRGVTVAFMSIYDTRGMTKWLWHLEGTIVHK